MQLRSTSGYPLFNFCDSLDDETSNRFHHQLGALLEQESPKSPLSRLEKLRSVHPQKFRLSSLTILRYLTQHSTEATSETAWHLGKCPFGKAAASLALALQSDSFAEIEELAQEAQKWLLNYNHKGTLYDLVSTKWPVWALLDLVQKKLLSPAGWTQIAGSRTTWKNANEILSGG